MTQRCKRSDCEVDFIPSRSFQIYCSVSCRKVEHTRRQNKRESGKRGQAEYRASEKGKATAAKNRVAYRESGGAQAAEAKYVGSEKGRASARRSAVRQYYADPERAKARNAVRHAVRDGLLTRPNKCSNLSAESHRGRIEAHHHKGYADEHKLDIVWLCNYCHREADASL